MVVWATRGENADYKKSQKHCIIAGPVAVVLRVHNENPGKSPGLDEARIGSTGSS